MFSGIVIGLGKVDSIEPKSDIATLVINTRGMLNGIAINDSVAVNGACLTVERIKKHHLYFSVVPATIVKTTLAELKVGDEVNLEPSLKLNDFVSGHFVLGHIDCTGTVVNVEELGDSREMTIKIPTKHRNLIVESGSVAVNGVSLTVAECIDNIFRIALIPHTLKLTNLDKYKINHRLNIEFDIMGKYILKSGVEKGRSNGL